MPVRDASANAIETKVGQRQASSTACLAGFSSQGSLPKPALSNLRYFIPESRIRRPLSVYAKA